MLHDSYTPISLEFSHDNTLIYFIKRNSDFSPLSFPMYNDEVY